MKFLNIEKSPNVFSKKEKHACHGYLRFEKITLYFPKKYTQYSEKDCIKWFNLCQEMFPNEYLGKEDNFAGESYTVSLDPKNYRNRTNMLAAATALRMVQYEYGGEGMTKIPETACKLMKLGLEFHEALHFAHFERNNICCGHSLRPYSHNFGVESLENLKPLERDSVVSGYLTTKSKKIKDVSSSGLTSIFSISKEFVKKVKNVEN